MSFQEELEQILREVAANPYKANEAVETALTSIINLVDKELPKPKQYGSNYEYSPKLTQKYIKEKIGEVTGYNRAILDMRAIIRSGIMSTNGQKNSKAEG